LNDPESHGQPIYEQVQKTQVTKISEFVVKFIAKLQERYYCYVGKSGKQSKNTITKTSFCKIARLSNSCNRLIL
jgi:hypothetical protein